MQVFLPFSSFEKSVSCLDNKRLGNQIYRECLTLIRGGWPYHPASKMWKGYESWLARYAICGLNELTQRGRHYPHHIETFANYLTPSWCSKNGINYYSKKPEWLGDERLHSSHRSALLYKDYAWYSQFLWLESPAVPYPNKRGTFSLPYYWPI